MKRLVHLLAGIVSVAAIATPAAGQRSKQIEFGAFGSYWRFDRSFLIKNGLGGGARIGYNLSDRLGLEVLGEYAASQNLAETQDITVATFGANLVLNFPMGERTTMFASGGYAQMVFGKAAPYDVTQHLVAGSLGARMFVSPHVAIRLEGRAQYRPDNPFYTDAFTGQVQGSAGISYVFNPPAPGQGGGNEPGAAPLAPSDLPAPPPPAPRPAPVRAASIPAARSQSIEFGGFGSYWRWDHLFFLKNSFGGGARISYFWSDRLSIEVAGDFTKTVDTAAVQDVSVSAVSGNLVFNFPMGDRATVFATGGFTRLVFGPDPPYAFTDNMINGGLGARVFLSPHLALRLDARAMYARGNRDPLNPTARGTWTGQVQGAAGASYFFIPPQQGRGFARQYQWYWGAQGGAFLSKTNTQPLVYDPIVGGHWLITARRTALYVAYEQAIFLTDAQAVIFDPNSSASSVGPSFRDVSFHDMRRLMFGVLAFPAQKVIEPFAGGGFALMQVLNPVVDCSGCTLSEATEAGDRAHEASSRAFFWLMGGLQINYSSKLNVFAHYVLTSSAANFLLESNTHTLQGGIRYSMGSSKEGITERH
ncbi:MAG: outer membrane beta-barrel protein [Gemmatimonadales bacterium]